MALETATHINDLVITNPDGLDDLSQGDNHIRMLKDVIKRDLPLTTPATALGISLLTSATAKDVWALIAVSNNPFRNVVINGNAEFDSRFGVNGSGLGAITFPSGGWLCDRWCIDGNVNSATTSYSNGIRGVDKYTGLGGGGVRIFTALSAQSTAHLINKAVTFSCNLNKSITGNVTMKVAIPAVADTFSSTLTTIYTNTVSVTSTSLATKLVGNFNLNSTTARGVFIEFSFNLETSSEFTFKEVQLELGTIAATDVVYEIVDPALEKLRCRYYFRCFSGVDGLTMVGAGRQTNTTSSRVTLPIDDMHRDPLVSFKGEVIVDIAGANPAATITTQYCNKNTVGLDVSHAANGASGQGVMLQIPNGSANRIEISAEVFSEVDG